MAELAKQRESTWPAIRHSLSGLLTLFFMLFFAATDARCQEIRGRVLDSSNGQPVRTAGVFLLDSERGQVAVSIADSLGRYRLPVPTAGEYFLFVQRIGYYETESPLLAVSVDRRYDVDLEIRPEPIALDPLLVGVRNDQFERWMKRRYNGSSNGLFGYRVIQGLRLEEARLRSKTSTDLFRWLFIPVSNGIEACVGWRIPEVERATQRMLSPTCGKVIVDDIPYPAEHLDGVDLKGIGIVVVRPPDVLIFTRGFRWNGRPGGG